MGDINPLRSEAASAVTDQLNMIMAGLDNIDQAMTIFDQDLNLVYANSRVHDLLGLPYEYMVKGTTLESIFRYNAMIGEYGIGDIDEMVNIRMETARKFESHVVERQRPNGIFIRVSGQPLDIGGFATIYTDITAQRQHEIKQEMLIAERTRELRHSEERLRLIANEVPAGIAYLDSDFIIRFANIRFARGYGKTPDETIGTPAQDLLGDKTFSVARSRFELAIAGKHSDFGMEITLVDGKERYIQTYLHPDFRQDGSARGFYVLSVNVTRQKQAEAALAQAQKMEAVGRLSSGIAHDFNNLLTIILGNLRALYDAIETEHLKTDMIEPALRAAQRGAGLTEQLLAFARRQPLTPKVIELSDCLQSVVKIMKSSLPGGVELIDRLPEGPIYAHLDRSQLESSLLNLLINALQAITGQGRIEISLAEIDGMAQIRVVDNGVGMDEELVKKIFDPFFTTKGDNGGTGLGLSMAQSFVEQSKGDLDITSKPGEGTQITILLPTVAPAEDSESADDALPSRLTQPEIALLVDDEEEVRAVCRRDLINLGYGVLEADSVEAALSLLDAVEGISFVLSDIAMPGGQSGYDLASEVIRAKPGVKIVLMTGHADTYTTKSVQGHTLTILRKPFDIKALQDAIRDVSTTGTSGNGVNENADLHTGRQ